MSSDAQVNGDGEVAYFAGFFDGEGSIHQAARRALMEEMAVLHAA